MGLKQDLIAAGGELVGTTMFLFLALGGAKTAQNSVTVVQTQTADTIALSQQTILFISLSFGFSLLVTAWIFYRITGGLFNPAVTLALWLIGGVQTLRACMLVVAQIIGGILGAGLVAALTPYGGVENTMTTLATYVNIGQGLMIEAFLTAMLVFSVLMLAAEKHKATFIAPIGIGLVLFVCQLFGTLWTGCGMNPARAFGPSVISASFPGYHWIYWVGPFIGSLIATGFYVLLKFFDYGTVVLGQDSDDVQASPALNVAARISHRFSHGQREALIESGMRSEDIDAAERGLLARDRAGSSAANGTSKPMSEKPGNVVNGSINGNNRTPSERPSLAPALSDRTEEGAVRHVNPRYATGSEHGSVAPASPKASPTKTKKRKSSTKRVPGTNKDVIGTGAVAQETGAIASPFTHTTTGYPKEAPQVVAEAQDVGGIGAPYSHSNVGLQKAKGVL